MAGINFAELAFKAERMTSDGLRAAIRDIQNTLANADAMDREDGGDRGGRYRDESSVYHAELRRRSTPVSEAEAEMAYELRANFEPGSTVVNVLTGKRTRVPR